MNSEEQGQKFHNYDLSLPLFRLVEAIFSTNQKHYLDHGSDMPSVRNFCASFVSQTSSYIETSGGVVKCQMFSQAARWCAIFFFRKSLQYSVTTC